MKRAALLASLALVAGAADAGATPAAGTAYTRGQVALMPLPKQALGHVAKPLLIDLSSGPADNERAAVLSFDPDDTAQSVRTAGRQFGHGLAYSEPGLRAFARGKGVIDVATSVEAFGSARQARLYGQKLRGDLAKVRGRNVEGQVLEDFERFRVRGLAHEGWGTRLRVRIGSLTFYGTYVDFRFGALLAEAYITRADDEDVADEVLEIARDLDRRIRGVITGRVRGPAVRSPRPAKPGPPRSGIDLAAIALKPADVPGTTVASQRYFDDPSALAAYARTFMVSRQESARTGVFGLQAEVRLLRSAQEARGRMLLLRAVFTAPSAAETIAQIFTSGTSADVRDPRVDSVSRNLGVGDESFAVSVSFSVGQPTRLRLVFLYVRVDQVVTRLIVTGAAPAFEIPGLKPLARITARRAQEELGDKLVA